jgi:hypothetical protein
VREPAYNNDRKSRLLYGEAALTMPAGPRRLQCSVVAPLERLVLLVGQPPLTVKVARVNGRRIPPLGPGLLRHPGGFGRGAQNPAAALLACT